LKLFKYKEKNKICKEKNIYYNFLVVTDTRKGGTGKNMPLLFLAPHPAIGGQASAG
jgi:hypothetical protein